MSDARKKITKTVVDKLRPSETVWDADVRGFAVRCQRRDRVYVLKYRLNGRQRWYTIGKHGSPWTVERARNEARRILGQVADGKDPASEKQSERDLPTIAELADLFLAEHVGAKSSERTEAEYRRLVERFVKPELGRRKVDDVTAADIRKLHFKFRATPYQANRILALLSKLFNWSGRRGDKNPCIGIERYAEQKRRRYLSQAELARLGVALHDAEVLWARDRPSTPSLTLLARPSTRPGERMTEKRRASFWERLPTDSEALRDWVDWSRSTPLPPFGCWSSPVPA